MTKNKIKLVAQFMLMIALMASSAFAQSGSGAIDLGNFRTVLETIVGLVLFMAAILCVWKLVMAFLDFRGQDFGHGMQNLIIAIIAGVIVGYGVLWINSLTGQSITATSF